MLLNICVIKLCMRDMVLFCCSVK